MKVSKKTQINFPYHAESVSKHVDHFKSIKFFEKKLEKLIIFRKGGGGAVGWGGYPFGKIINLIFEQFPNNKQGHNSSIKNKNVAKRSRQHAGNMASAVCA